MTVGELIQLLIAYPADLRNVRHFELAGVQPLNPFSEQESPA